MAPAQFKLTGSGRFQPGANCVRSADASGSNLPGRWATPQLSGARICSSCICRTYVPDGKRSSPQRQIARATTCTASAPRIGHQAKAVQGDSRTAARQNMRSSSLSRPLCNLGQRRGRLVPNGITRAVELTPRRRSGMLRQAPRPQIRRVLDPSPPGLLRHSGHCSISRPAADPPQILEWIVPRFSTGGQPSTRYEPIGLETVPSGAISPSPATTRALRGLFSWTTLWLPRVAANPDAPPDPAQGRLGTNQPSPDLRGAIALARRHPVRLAVGKFLSRSLTSTWNSRRSVPRRLVDSHGSPLN